MATTKQQGQGLAEDLERRLAPVAERKASGADALAGLVTKMRGEIGKALPAHFKANAERYARQAVTLIRQNPKLANCSPASFLGALLTASGLGLDLTPALGQCYILPYSRRAKVGGEWTSTLEAQFQIGFRGLLDMAMRSGRVVSVFAEVVFEQDQFQYCLGLSPDLAHVPCGLENPGPAIAYYAVAHLAGGGRPFAVMTRAQALAHAKKFSPSYSATTGSFSGPWGSDFDAMATKTVLKKLLKMLPLGVEVAQALTHDGSTKTVPQDMKTEAEILDVTAVEVEVVPEEIPVAVE